MKKLKRKFKKLALRLDAYLNAQMFYAKRACKKALLASVEVTALTIKLVAFAVITSLCFIFAEKAHNKYIEKKVGSQVLFIKAMPDNPAQGSATGFEVVAKSGKTYILTNAHVCGLKDKDNLVSVQNKLHSGRFIPRRVIEIYAHNDLCLVEGFEGYPGLKLGEAPSVSDNVIAIGYPMGEALNISRGRIKAYTTVEIIAEDIPIAECHGDRLRTKRISVWFFDETVCMRSYKAIASDVPIYPGNSGSPIVDMWGNVVAVAFASDGFTHWGVLVPFKDIQKFLEAY